MESYDNDNFTKLSKWENKCLQLFVIPVFFRCQKTQKPQTTKQTMNQKKSVKKVFSWKTNLSRYYEQLEKLLVREKPKPF